MVLAIALPLLIYKLQLNRKLNTLNCLENDAGHTPSNL